MIQLNVLLILISHAYMIPFYVLGCNTSLSLHIGVLCDPTHTCLNGELWRSQVLSRSSVIKEIIIDTQPLISTANVANNTMKWINSNVDAVILAGFDFNVNIAAVLLEQAGIPFIVSTSPITNEYRCTGDSAALAAQVPCHVANTRRWNYGHNIWSPVYQYYEPFISQLRLYGATTLAVVYPNLPVYQEMFQGAQTTASDNSMSVVYNATYTFPSASMSELASITSSLSSIAPDGVILMGIACNNWISHWYNNSYLPKAVGTAACIDSLTPSSQFSDQGDRLRYISGMSTWDARLKGANYQESSSDAWSIYPYNNPGSIPSAKQFNTSFYQFVGHVPDYFDAGTSASFELLGGGIEEMIRVATAQNQSYYRTNTNNMNNNTHCRIDPNLLNRQLDIFYASSFYGILSTNQYGYNIQKGLVMIQRYGSTMYDNNIISPLSSQTSTFIYPMPTWEERTYQPQMFHTISETIITIIVVIASLYCIIIAIITYMYRNNQHVRAGAVKFVVMMVFGGVWSLLSILSWGVESNSSTCGTRPWLFPMGFQLFFAPLLARSLRIAIIFGNVFTMKKGQTDSQVIRNVGLFILPQLIISIVWSCIALPTPVILVNDPLRPSQNVTVCSTAYNGLFEYLSLSYGILCLVFASILAFRVRLAYEMFNDASAIANCVFLLTITSTIIIAVQIAFGNGATTKAQIQNIFVIRAILIIIAAVSGVTLVALLRILKLAGFLPHSSGTVRGNSLGGVMRAVGSGSGRAHAGAKKHSHDAPRHHHKLSSTGLGTRLGAGAGRGSGSISQRTLNGVGLGLPGAAGRRGSGQDPLDTTASHDTGTGAGTETGTGTGTAPSPVPAARDVYKYSRCDSISTAAGVSSPLPPADHCDVELMTTPATCGKQPEPEPEPDTDPELVVIKLEHSQV